MTARGTAMVLQPDPRVAVADLAGTRVVFHLGDRRLHVLNATAAAIWDELSTARATSVDELVVVVADRFGVDPDGIRADVERLLDLLRIDGLLAADPTMTTMTTMPMSMSGDATPSEVRWAAPKGPVSAPGAGSYRVLDARVAIECPDGEVVGALSRVLAPLWCDDAPTVAIRVSQQSDTAWSVAVGDDAPVSVGSRLAVTLRAIGEVNEIAVASAPGDLVFHAGAVGGAHGAVLLPGASNHGKSTLTTALVRSGFAYLTDEAAAVTDRLTVRPFPKSIALDPGSFPLFPDLAPPIEAGDLAHTLGLREWHVAPARIGTVGTECRIRVVVCPHWRPGASTRLHRVDPTEALHELLGDVFDFAVGGQPVFERLVELVASVPVYRLGYGDLDEAVAVVDALAHDPDAVTG